ncbi:leucine-rich repeat domain-containing protein [Cytophagaceae bacterium DM2B3-1]|uniref:Leucine-rich repeat domain-containing protein n=1 Tax=Xanthocytophaga flava TaxID=3048013 RepID=A0ABT7CQ06_9BACT|nr:leucine-rich repeat domain-containing protein [Xanthocytophaga flavus]MDJ1467251.1 leucine-rich repeat domain-containing protein [Xanthocytophaga flavus]MDJ1494754.1 leucine-rich repeat domain-containing protein [Xanthocytophaga flavus]
MADHTMSTTKFLEEVNEEQKLFIENLRRLLSTGEEANCKMAIEIMKGGGVPSSMYEDLLIYSKILPEASQRTLIRKLLAKQTISDWKNLIEDTTAFVNIETTKEKDIRDKMAKMCKTVGWEETALLGYLFFQRYRKGLSFILSYPHRNPFRIKALEMLTHGDVFDFHTGIGYYTWKGTQPEEVILSNVDTKIKFPDDHPNATTLRVLNFHNCKLDSIPNEIAAFENVEELDLSVNNLKKLPVSFTKLTHLRKLDLSFNRFTEFPKVLIKMTALQELDFRYNNKSAYSFKDNTLVIPDEFYTQMPNCKVLV